MTVLLEVTHLNFPEAIKNFLGAHPHFVSLWRHDLIELFHILRFGLLRSSWSSPSEQPAVPMFRHIPPYKGLLRWDPKSSSLDSILVFVHNHGDLRGSAHVSRLDGPVVGGWLATESSILSLLHRFVESNHLAAESLGQLGPRAASAGSRKGFYIDVHTNWEMVSLSILSLSILITWSKHILY